MTGFAALVFVLFMGCAATQTAKDAYLMARLQFNEEVKRYNTYYEDATVDQQSQFQKEIEPYIIETENALDVWGSAVTLGNGDGSEVEAYITAKNKMIDALVKIYEKKEPDT